MDSGRWRLLGLPLNQRFTPVLSRHVHRVPRLCLESDTVMGAKRARDRSRINLNQHYELPDVGTELPNATGAPNGPATCYAILSG